MRPDKPETSNGDLFRSSLKAILDMDHELVQLAGLISWDRFDDAFGQYYHDSKGRRGLRTRLMVGLHLLKHMKGLSDEEACAAWRENPYFQFFCGESHFQHRLPFDRTSMTRWRKRIGPDEMELVLAETLAVAIKTDAVSQRQLERVTVDTTVQTKAIAHPTDSHLILRAIEWLNRVSKRCELKLRQAFTRKAKDAKKEAARLLHTGGHKQGLRWIRKMRTWLGRLIRDIRRKIAGKPELDAAFKIPLERAERILAQSHATKTSSMHCTPRKSNVLERAKPEPDMSSGAKPPWLSPTRPRRAASSSSAPCPCPGTLMMAIHWEIRSTRSKR